MPHPSLIRLASRAVEDAECTEGAAWQLSAAKGFVASGALEILGAEGVLGVLIWSRRMLGNLRKLALLGINYNSRVLRMLRMLRVIDGYRSRSKLGHITASAVLFVLSSAAGIVLAAWCNSSR